MSQQAPALCRCPVRPYATPGSLASGSAHESAQVQRWQEEHGAHAYAKARDQLAGALQGAESAVASGEAMLDMVHDVLGRRRPSETVLNMTADSLGVDAGPRRLSAHGFPSSRVFSREEVLAVLRAEEARTSSTGLNAEHPLRTQLAELITIFERMA